MKGSSKKFLSLLLATFILATSLPGITFAEGDQDKPETPGVETPKEPEKPVEEPEKPEEYVLKSIQATVKAGEEVKVEDLVFDPTLPEGTKVEIISQKDGKGKVKVTFSEDNVKEYDFEAKVEEKEDEAASFKPEVKALIVDYKGKVDITQAIANLPEGAKVEILKDVDTEKLGKQEGQVLITFKDGSTRKVDIPVEVVDKENKTVLITFDPMKGKVKETSRRIKKDTEVGKLPVAEREGFKFEGWYLEKDYKTVVKATMKFDKDTTVYAKWSEKTTDQKEITNIAYIVGYPDGTFRPGGNVTRAEAAQMFATLLNGSNNFVTSKATKFSDANNQWFSQAVNYVVEKGLIQGYGDGSFKPNNNITRGEFAQMISGMLEIKEKGKTTFTDVKGHWANDAIEKVYGNKKVSGYPDGTFRPNRDITRAEAVTIFNAVFNRVSKIESFKNVTISNLNQFKDVKSDHWAYYQILDGANGHVSIKDEEGVDIWK